MSFRREEKRRKSNQARKILAESMAPSHNFPQQQTSSSIKKKPTTHPWKEATVYLNLRVHIT